MNNIRTIADTGCWELMELSSLGKKADNSCVNNMKKWPRTGISFFNAQRVDTWVFRCSESKFSICLQLFPPYQCALSASGPDQVTSPQKPESDSKFRKSAFLLHFYRQVLSVF